MRLIGALTTMLVLLLFSSSVIYVVERAHQPDTFGSIPEAGRAGALPADDPGWPEC